MKNIVAAATASIALMAGNAQSQEVLEMTSAFGQNLPILGTAAVDFTKNINSISNDVEFEHYDPGKLVPTLEALDAVSNGSVDAAYATSGYWQGKINAASLFAAVPFGPEAGEFLGWVLYDDGAKYWQQSPDLGPSRRFAHPAREPVRTVRLQVSRRECSGQIGYYSRSDTASLRARSRCQQRSIGHLSDL